jgi:hypothetical protein
MHAKDFQKAPRSLSKRKIPLRKRRTYWERLKSTAGAKAEQSNEPSSKVSGKKIIQTKSMSKKNASASSNGFSITNYWLKINSDWRGQLLRRSSIGPKIGRIMKLRASWLWVRPSFANHRPSRSTS